MVPVLDSMAKIRTGDVCVLHDIEAAEEMTGGPANYIVPADPIGRCSMSIEYAGGDTVLTVDIELNQIENWYESIILESDELDEDIEMFGAPPPAEGIPDFGTSCAVFYPVEEPFGIELDINSLDDPAWEEACDTAADYLVAVLPEWEDPPLVEDGITTPHVSVYGLGPCSILGPAAEKYPQDEFGNENIIVSGSSPYQCELRSVESSADPTIDVRYTGLVGVHEDAEEMEMAGAPVYVDDDDFRGCSYRISFNDPVKFNLENPDWPGRSPGVEIEMPECDHELVSETVALILGQEPLPEGSSDGPISLGKLR